MLHRDRYTGHLLYLSWAGVSWQGIQVSKVVSTCSLSNEVMNQMKSTSADLNTSMALKISER